MPLKSAEEHINREGLSDRIGTVLSDGLDNVPPEGITDVVMAGMGGELIARLLEMSVGEKQREPRFTAYDKMGRA